jgi:hypothetical protein
MTDHKKASTRIGSLEDLIREQKKVKATLRIQEEDLRSRVRRVPGELFYSGLNSVIPPMLSGKITNTVLNTGKDWVNRYFSGQDPQKPDSKLMTAIKQVGIFSLLRFAFRAFIRKK